MLEKNHAADAGVGGYHPGGFCAAIFKSAPQAHCPGVPVGFGIGVGFTERAILVGIRAFNVACGFLVEINQCHSRGDVQGGGLNAVAKTELLLIDTGVVAVTALAAAGKSHGQGFTAAAETETTIIVGAPFQAYAGRAVKRRRFENIDDPVQGIGSEEGIAGSANHLNACGLFAVAFEEFIDIAKTCRAQGNSVFSNKKATAGASAG